MSHRSLHLAIAAAMLALLGLTALGGFGGPTRLEDIRKRGTLAVAMRIGPVSFVPAENNGAASEPGGFEYELLVGFAEALAVDLDVRPVASIEQAMALLENGTVDLVAAGVSATPARRDRFAFTRGYLETQPRIVHRNDVDDAESVEDLVGQRVEALAHTVHARRLREIANDREALTWRTLERSTTEQLLYRVWRGRSDYALTDELFLALNRPFYPELRAGMALGPPRELAWMMHISDQELLEAANAYLQARRDEGMLAVLRDEHFGHLQEFDYVGTRTFLRHITERLPRFRDLFTEAAQTNGIDWRLLAAVGYQESHWDPDAVSPTGVRGVMMLTQDTAEFIGIDDRRDPAQSIRGGAAYLASLRERMPEDIPEPSRTWLTLAAYNVGLGHLEDARRITEMRGGNPDEWFDVRKNLPLLAKQEWHQRVTHGYARGWEPVRYVENIRRYFHLLERVTQPGQPDTPSIAREALLPRPLRIPASIESML